MRASNNIDAISSGAMLVSVIDRVSKLTIQEKIRFFHLMAQSICLHARGLASDSKKPTELRLLQSDAIIEMQHRLFEQSEHYYKRDDVQRPESALFELLQSLETTAQMCGIISSAYEYAFRHLPDAG